MSKKNNDVKEPIAEDQIAEQPTVATPQEAPQEAPFETETWINPTAGKIEIVVNHVAVAILPGEKKELPAGLHLNKYRLDKA